MDSKPMMMDSSTPANKRTSPVAVQKKHRITWVETNPLRKALQNAEIKLSNQLYRTRILEVSQSNLKSRIALLEAENESLAKAMECREEKVKRLESDVATSEGEVLDVAECVDEALDVLGFETGSNDLVENVKILIGVYEQKLGAFVKADGADVAVDRFDELTRLIEESRAFEKGAAFSHPSLKSSPG